MTGIDVDAEKDASSLNASAIASEMLDAPSPGRKRRGSTKRCKSVLLGLDMDDGKSSGDESVSGSSLLHQRAPSPSNRRRGSLRRPSLFADDNEPTGTSLLNQRAPSPSMNSRRSNTVQCNKHFEIIPHK